MVNRMDNRQLARPMMVDLEDHELNSMRELAFYLPAIARSLHIQGSDVSWKLMVWNSDLQNFLDRIDTEPKEAA
jgi:hypothetical protein